MIALVILGLVCSFIAGFTFAFVILRTPDDPLSVERMSQPTPTPEKRFFPGDPEEPVYEGPAWDLPGVERQ